MDIVEFLTVRLDEDEADAKAARTTEVWEDGYEDFDEDAGGNLIGDGRSSVNNGYHLPPRPIVVVHESWKYPPQGYELVEHIARHDPARVLRDVEAKRRIMAEAVVIRDSLAAGWGLGPTDGENTGYTLLRLLAAVWSDHPDYQPEWAPEGGAA
jgi:hypothetical protein